MGDLLYLAYGSNLWPARLLARTPSARAVGVVRLDGWRLSFAKRSHDGSGKCTIAPADGGVVHGAIYRLDPADKPLLDAVEGLGHGYDEVHRELEGIGRVGFYVAQDAFHDPSLRPYRWYHAFVVAGARWHGFPEPYVAALEQIHAVPDPDRARATENAAILATSPDAVAPNDHTIRIRRRSPAFRSRSTGC